ncbi:hypothetical protein PTKIN_Ptkin15bG0179100 [Pterospermum kingtungense]
MKYSLRSLLGFLKVLKKKSPHEIQSSDKKSPDQTQFPELPEGICRPFSLAEIKAATNNFHENSIIGQGRFGEVYKGTIDDGTMVVAVKRYGRKLLRREKQSEQFRNEVLFLCQLRHPHLISFIGICLEENDMFIVYEYMSRGSLDWFLYSRNYLAWKHRLQICIGAARMEYITFTQELSIPFGWSKRVPSDMSKSKKRLDSEEVLGVDRYMAPEYFINEELTEKSDVFSFGVVLFEVLCSRIPPNHELLGWASEFIREEAIYNAIDSNIEGTIATDCLKKYLEIACSCVKHNPNERPDMGEVEVTLELTLELQEKADSKMESINPQVGR